MISFRFFVLLLLIVFALMFLTKRIPGSAKSGSTTTFKDTWNTDTNHEG